MEVSMKRWSGGIGFCGALVLACAAPLAQASAQAYQEVQVTGGGGIKGKVVYSGRVPTRMIVPTKDLEVCGEPREEPEVKLGPDRGVQNSIVYLEGVKQGKAWPAAAKAPTLDNKDCLFQPHVQAIPVGKLAVLNSDPMLHNTHGFYGRRSAFNIALPNRGQRIDVDLPRTGQVRIECDAHGWMRGWIYVVDNPYNVVTGEDGTFVISDVPPGNYTLVADQAYTGPVKVGVTVKSGETVEVPVELRAPDRR
jgi:Carboxypeptidase regulatory-like domain